MYKFKIETNALSESFIYDNLGIDACKPEYNVYIKCYKQESKFKDGYVFMLNFAVHCDYCYDEGTSLLDIKLFDDDIDTYKETYNILVEYKDKVLKAIENRFDRNMLKNFYNKFYEKIMKIIQGLVYEEEKEQEEDKEDKEDNYEFQVETDAVSDKHLSEIASPNFYVYIEFYKNKIDKKKGYDFMLSFKVQCDYYYYTSTSIDYIELYDIDGDLEEFSYKKQYELLVTYKDKILYAMIESFDNTILENLDKKIYEDILKIIENKSNN